MHTIVRIEPFPPVSPEPHRQFYVYELLDPSDQNRPFYVGKGRGWRATNHYCPSYLRAKHYKNHIIKAYREAGFPDKFRVVESGLSETEAFELETKLIAHYGSRYDGSGTLVNLSAGGEGSSGCNQPKTNEHRQKISVAKKGKPFSDTHRQALKRAAAGRSISPEVAAKISLSLKGRTKSDDHQAAITASLKGRVVSPEGRQRMSEGFRANPRDNGCAKWYRVTPPDGIEVIVKNLAAFCRDRGLSKALLGRVALGRNKHHKGYRASFIEHCGMADADVS